MFSWNYVYQLERQRRLDEMEMVLQDHLLREVSNSQPGSAKPYQRLLSWFGGMMIAWGCRLQTRYEVLVAASVEPQISPQEPAPCSS